MIQVVQHQTAETRHWSMPTDRAPETRRSARIAAKNRRKQRRTWFAWIPLVALAVAAVIAMYLLGWSSYIITGGSMTGSIPKGALAIEHQVPVSSLQVGDIITFHPPGEDNNVTHRIVAITPGPDGQSVFTTKGDANEDSDPWQITLDGPKQARFSFSIPWVGYALAFFTLRWVRTALLAFSALALLLGVLFHLRQDGSRETRTAGARAADCRDEDR
jgi:signal peptidase I